jgi:polyisoprenoid-binding protein YceI
MAMRRTSSQQRLLRGSSTRSVRSSPDPTLDVRILYGQCYVNYSREGEDLPPFIFITPMAELALKRIGVLLAVVATVDVTAATSTFHVDPANSRATIHVGKAGAFSFIAGHTHEVRGPVQSGSVDVDPDAPSQSRVRIVIAASELKVSAAGEPTGDAPKVQEAMDSEKVLDVERYPRITYESTSVTLKSRHDRMLELMVAGRLTIRDVTQPVTAPVRVEVADNTLTATGRFAVKQSAFGITPISVGGVVSVKDALEIEFSILAKK